MSGRTAMQRGCIINFTVYPKEGDSFECSLPAKWGVCPRCRGEGTHTNPSIDGNGITASEMEELGDDFREDYMDGVYDVQCSECKGTRVVAVPDVSRWTFGMKRYFVQHRRDERESAREDASERWLRMAESGERW